MRRFPGTQKVQLNTNPDQKNARTTAVPQTAENNLSDKQFADVLDADYEESAEEVYVEGDSVYYSTGEVAQRLGISRDMTRSHMKEFEEFLHITYSRPESRYSHMRLLSTDMDLLERIVRLRKNGHTAEHVKQILLDPELAGAMKAPPIDIGNALSEVLVRNNAALLSEVKKILDSNAEQTLHLLEANSEKDQKIDSLSNEVEHLKELLLKQSLTMHQQSEKFDSLQAMLQEQIDAHAKKKGFWNLFK